MTIKYGKMVLHCQKRGEENTRTNLGFLKVSNGTRCIDTGNPCFAIYGKFNLPMEVTNYRAFFVRATRNKLISNMVRTQ